MSPETFRDSVLAALSADNEDALNQLVDAYEPINTDVPNEAENEALTSIGKYGYSGRTERYRPVVETLIDNGLQPDLTSCAYLGLSDLAKELVARDSDLVNALNGEGFSPLHAAAERGDLAIVTWLCEAGADPHMLSSGGELPIARALHAGPWKSERALDVVDFLAPLCALDQQLWFAAGRGDVERVKSILSDTSVNVDEPDNAGETSLFHACHNNQPEIVQLLLDAGADSNLKTTSGDSPLATACLHSLSQECDISIIKALMNAGADKSIEAAVILEDVSFIREYFERHPQKLDDDDPITPLHYAVHTGVGESLAVLVELGAKPDDGLWRHIERIFGSDVEYLERLRNLNRQN